MYVYIYIWDAVGPLKQEFTSNYSNCLHGTDVSEFIYARYGSLVKLLQDGTRHNDFVVTVGSKGTPFIDYAPKMVLPKPVWVSPADSMPIDSDSAALMSLSVGRCGFPCPARHFQLYPNFPNTRVKVSLSHRTLVRCCHIIVTLLLGCHSERKDIVHDHGVRILRKCSRSYER
jgi:hypothetical protein